MDKTLNLPARTRGRRSWLVLIVAALVGGALGAGPIAANAVMSYSSWGVYGPVYGTTYANRSGGDSTANSHRSDVRTDAGTNVPAYYMGVNSRVVVNSSGALCYETGMAYNNVPINTWNIGAGVPGCPGGVLLYTQATTQAYNGGGYSTYYALQSPLWLN